MNNSNYHNFVRLSAAANKSFHKLAKASVKHNQHSPVMNVIMLNEIVEGRLSSYDKYAEYCRKHGLTSLKFYFESYQDVLDEAKKAQEAYLLSQ